MSAARETPEMRRAALVNRAAAEREALAGQLAVLGRLDKGLEDLGLAKRQLPPIAIGAGLGLSALLLALPAGLTPVVRGGIALLQVAGSVRRLFSAR